MLETLPEDRCWLELAGFELGHLAIVSDGEPYITPVSFVAFAPSDEKPGTVRFRTVQGRRMKAMQEGGRVCIEASDVNNATGSWISVLAWGHNQPEVTPLEEQETITALLRKYHTGKEDPFRLPAPSLTEPEVVIITIDTISGRASGKGLRPGLRPGRL
jgi:nitroimidazol reductase NimA-like FMN-containing flavoprotein (pyridoxamine 5'-phosphate oxidase superfamily)